MEPYRQLTVIIQQFKSERQNCLKMVKLQWSSNFQSISLGVGGFNKDKVWRFDALCEGEGCLSAIASKNLNFSAFTPRFSHQDFHSKIFTPRFSLQDFHTKISTPRFSRQDFQTKIYNISRSLSLQNFEKCRITKN